MGFVLSFHACSGGDMWRHIMIGLGACQPKLRNKQHENQIEPWTSYWLVTLHFVAYFMLNHQPTTSWDPCSWCIATWSKPTHMIDVDQGVTHVMSHACINHYQGFARQLSSDHSFLLRNAVGHVIQRMVPCLLFPPRLFLRVNPLPPPIGGSRVGTGDRCCGLRPRLPGMPRVEEAGRGALGGNAQQGRPALHVRPYYVRPLYETLIYIYIYILHF
jgi:hypothetical protein